MKISYRHLEKGIYRGKLFPGIYRPFSYRIDLIYFKVLDDFNLENSRVTICIGNIFSWELELDKCNEFKGQISREIKAEGLEDFNCPIKVYSNGLMLEKWELELNHLKI